MRKSGQCRMFITDRTIVLVGRKWRSKWWGITCCGCGKSRRRKDGSCKHERQVLEMIRPELRNRTRIVPGVTERRRYANNDSGAAGQ